jgi:hypothetical protein
VIVNPVVRRTLIADGERLVEEAELEIEETVSALRAGITREEFEERAIKIVVCVARLNQISMMLDGFRTDH